MVIRKAIAKLLKIVAKRNMSSACGLTFYQPEVPRVLKRKKSKFIISPKRLNNI